MPIDAAHNFFVDNRERLVEKMQGEVIVLSAYTLMQRSNDILAPFEQEANFWWLCGLELPDWWLIIDGTRSKSFLVAPFTSVAMRDEVRDQIISESGVNDVLTQDTGGQMLRELSKRHSIVRTVYERPRREYSDYALNPAPKKMYEMLDRIFVTVQDCKRELTQLRAVKQPEELIRIKKAVNLTSDGFELIKSQLEVAKYEYEIEASLTHHVRMNGAKGMAYSPVVASGIHACNLGYVANSGRLRKKETVLIDGGARLNGYTASIARTYGYGGVTRRQLAIHEALVNARERIIGLLEPNLPVDKYQRDVDIIMKETLVSLGLMQDEKDLDAYRRYFPHSISHGVGVDVHDSLGVPHFFKPGMVLSVEPGVYIPEEKIGMRLGDVIQITTSGRVNLSARLSTDL